MIVANYISAERIWENKGSTISQAPCSGQRLAIMTSVGAVTHLGKRRSLSKCMKVRESKLAPWVVVLEADLISEFNIL